MSRESMLGAIRRATGRSGNEAEARRTVEARLAAHARNLVPARGAEDASRVDRFAEMAEYHAASLARVASDRDIPAAVATFIRRHNLPARVKIAPDAALGRLDWSGTALDTATGIAEATDEVGLAAAFAGVAETGTLMLHSGPERSTTLNFLPENHVVVIRASQIVGSYEDGWAHLREMGGGMPGFMPRTVNFITGPSRTADIEQTIFMGAHGPKRLHIVLVEDA